MKQWNEQLQILQVTVDGFLRFADFFFDDVFSSWAIFDRIGQSKAQVENVRNQIQDVLRRLKNMQDETERSAMKTKGDLEALVLGME